MITVVPGIINPLGFPEPIDWNPNIIARYNAPDGGDGIIMTRSRDAFGPYTFTWQGV